MTIETSTFTIDCTGNACTGDIILFTEGVFGGSFRKPKFLGQRRIAGRITKDSYGSGKQQHTFTIEVVGSDGCDALAPGTMTRRKARSVYRNGTMRQPWADESARQAALDDKYQRGNAARAAREERKKGDDFC